MQEYNKKEEQKRTRDLVSKAYTKVKAMMPEMYKNELPEKEICRILSEISDVENYLLRHCRASWSRILLTPTR